MTDLPVSEQADDNNLQMSDTNVKNTTTNIVIWQVDEGEV